MQSKICCRQRDIYGKWVWLSFNLCCVLRNWRQVKRVSENSLLLLMYSWKEKQREREGERFTHIDLTLCSFSWYQLHRNFPHTKLLRYSIMDQTKCGSSFEWNNCNQFMHENLRCVAVRSTLNKQIKRMEGGRGGGGSHNFDKLKLQFQICS